MPDLVLEMHRRRTPLDHPLRSVTRTHLEYPTEDVAFVYLEAIGKAEALLHSGVNGFMVTTDGFSDKAVRSVCGGWRSKLYGRLSDTANNYQQVLDSGLSSADHYIAKVVGGTLTKLATESVDIHSDFHFIMFSISGSTLKGFRDDLTTPRITATDTTFTSGRYGYGVWDIDLDGTGRIHYNPVLLPPASRLPQSITVIECEITGSGKEDDPIRPRLTRQLVEISKLTNIPEFLKLEAKRYELLKQKGFTDDEIEALLGYIPQHQVDLASVSWGAFDHKPGHSTMLIVVTSDNPYMEGAIDKQVEYARSKNLKVLKPPRDYSEAIEQHRELKKDFPEWIAGKDNYAYQTLGHEVLELFQVADTYHGNIVEGIKPNAYKNVPDWEMRRILNTWMERLKKVSVLAEERDKHVRKIEKVLKLGW